MATKGTKGKAETAKTLQYSGSVHHALGAYIMGEWKFEGNCDDTSGNGHNGTCTGLTFVDNDISELGIAGQFNGTTDYVEVANFNDINGLESLTVIGWVKTGDTSWMLVSKYQTDGKLFFVWFATDKLYFTMTGLLPLYHFCTKISDTNLSDFFKSDEWHFIAATYDGSERAIYLDGEKCNSLPASGKIDAGSSPLRIGAYHGAYSYNLEGLIDEVRIYEEALSSAQIQKLYVEGAMKRGIALE